MLSLLAALTGTPLRQAEAAADLSRSLAVLFQPANLEPPDGGVGDDSGVVIATATHIDFAAASLLASEPILLPPEIGMPCLTPVEAECLRERVWWPSAPPGIRHAWLQIFLF